MKQSKNQKQFYEVKAEVKFIKYYIVQADSRDEAMDLAESRQFIVDDRSDEDENIFDAEVVTDKVSLQFYRSKLGAEVQNRSKKLRGVKK